MGCRRWVEGPEPDLWICEETGRIYETYEECMMECGAAPPPSEPELTIAVTPRSGYVGDTFHFLGTLYMTQGGGPISGKTVRLYKNGSFVGSDVTDSYGNWSIDWVADRAGTFTFYAEATV